MKFPPKKDFVSIRLHTFILVSLCVTSSLFSMELAQIPNDRSQGTELIPAPEFLKKLPADTWKLIMEYLDTDSKGFRYLGRYIKPHEAQLENVVDEIELKLSVACDTLQKCVDAMGELLANDHITLYIEEHKNKKQKWENRIVCVDQGMWHIEISRRVGGYKDPDTVSQVKKAIIFIPCRLVQKVDLSNQCGPKDETGESTYQSLRRLLGQRLRKTEKLSCAVTKTIKEMRDSNHSLKQQEIINHFIEAVSSCDSKNRNRPRLMYHEDSQEEASQRGDPLLAETESANDDIFKKLDSETLKKLSIILAKSHCLAKTYEDLLEVEFYILDPVQSSKPLAYTLQKGFADCVKFMMRHRLEGTNFHSFLSKLKKIKLSAQ